VHPDCDQLVCFVSHYLQFNTNLLMFDTDLCDSCSCNDTPCPMCHFGMYTTIYEIKSMIVLFTTVAKTAEDARKRMLDVIFIALLVLCCDKLAKNSWHARWLITLDLIVLADLATCHLPDEFQSCKPNPSFRASC
jgi:hypothetical protein